MNQQLSCDLGKTFTVIVYQDHVQVKWESEKDKEVYWRNFSKDVKIEKIYRKIKAKIFQDTLAKVDNLFSSQSQKLESAKGFA